MRIPSGNLDDFAAELIEKCLITRKDRVPVYGGFKHYYLFGAQEGEQAPYNKISPHMDLLSAYLYSESTVELDVSVFNKPAPVFKQAELISKRANIYLHDCGIAHLFSNALKWSLVFNSTLVKLLWRRGRIEPYMIEPHNFGVMREDVTDLNRQEAFVHCYRISESELRRRINGLPNAAQLLEKIVTTPSESIDAFPEPINRMIIAGAVNMASSTTRGFVNVPDLIGSMAYRPRSAEDTAEMYELWVWDDATDDWRTITVAEPGLVLYDGRTIGNLLGIKGCQPFVHICPNPIYDYFYGWSEVANLIRLQDWLTIRLREIRQILSKQANPPKYLAGFTGIPDEKIAALSDPGAWISEPNPSAKVDTLAPDLPNDLFQEFLLIQDMFNDESGLSDVLQGKGETGVRAKGHADILARLGSARIKQRALAIEQTISDMGRLIVEIMRAKDTTRYQMEGGDPFVASQFTGDFRVQVDAHSASPVFMEEADQKAFALAKMGAIDPDSLLELVKPPKVDTLRQRYKELEAKRAAQAQAMAAMGVQPGSKGGGLKAVGG